MRRVLFALLLVLGLAPGTWFHEAAKPWNPKVDLTFTPVAVPPRAALARHLGAFELEGAWAMTSTYGAFGGYSALLVLPDGRLMAFSDNGRRFTFSPPGAPPSRLEMRKIFASQGIHRFDSDVESATRDPATGTVWIGREYVNAISRHDPAFRTRQVIAPPAMADWGGNEGPEAMARLGDGRFVVLREGWSDLLILRRHRALLFPGDPLARGKPAQFAFDGPAGFQPTDMAQLPDGRVLILMRRLVWPLPLRFAGRIVIADPADIRPGRVWRGVEVAKLTSTLPVDNFEGLAIAARRDGHVTVWLISDDNRAATQRTMLWKLAVDPARLPRIRKKARS